ncbi:MAG: CorA family divalent cation transporter [Gemmatimonadaceae bacterium]
MRRSLAIQAASAPTPSKVRRTGRADPTYGSDRTGLVWGYVFAPGETPREVDSDTAARLLAESDKTSSFLWLHFSLSNVASERWLEEHVEPPEEFFASLREGVGSTRLEQYEDALVAILHDVLFEFALDPDQVATVGLLVRPRYLVSTRLRPLRSIDRLRAVVRGGETFRSSVDLLAHLLRDQAGVLVEIVRQVTSRVDAIEDGILRRRIGASRSELGSLRRVLVRLQRLLAPEPPALFRLLGRPPHWISDDDQRDLRQSAEEFATAVADSVALVERVRLIQEELATLISEGTNRSLFLLTVLTVLALPFNVVGSLLGMNVGGIPFAESPVGFTVIVLFVVGLTTVAWKIFRRRRGPEDPR